MIIMKHHRLRALTTLSLLVVVNTRADINIHVAGAVSLQDVTYNTLVGLFGANLTSQNLSSPTKPTSANVFTMTGQITNLFGSQTVTIYVNWSGSGPAIQSLTGNGTVNFYASPIQGVTNLVPAAVDVGGSVVYQNDYPYATPALNDSTYGVTPTIFARSPQAPATLTNITSQQLRFIEANGSAPESLFTAPISSIGSCATSGPPTELSPPTRPGLQATRSPTITPTAPGCWTRSAGPPGRSLSI
jgi:hypothetical protein